ncbi:MAG: methyltransferase domain-containing protein, partial [Desulfobacterales bacterium]
MSEHKHTGQVVTTHWDPNQYLKFSDHRLRPAIELLDRIPLESPKVIFDLGCGAGNVTRIIADRWKSAQVYGLDKSRDMLQKAQLEPEKIQWVEADIENWIPDEAPDLIYSNATLQWVKGHRELFPRLVGFLRPGGCLAVQMPLSWEVTSHRLMRETLADGGRRGSPLGTEELRKTMARKWVEESEVYYDLLAGKAESLDIWETEYLQVLQGDDPVLEWVQGTALRPVLNGLADDEREIFLNK